LIPISLVIVIAGVVSYVTSIDAKGSETASRVERMSKFYSDSISKITDRLDEIKERLVRIEANQNGRK